MIQINQLKLSVEKNLKEDGEILQLKKRAVKKIREEIGKKKIKLKISVNDINCLTILKKSIDARKKTKVHYSYSVKAECPKEIEQKLCSLKLPDILLTEEKKYHYKPCGTKPLKHPPVIVGMGPAGLFLGMMLSEAGFCPVILEQGSDIDKRQETVENFWKTGRLNPQRPVWRRRRGNFFGREIKYYGERYRWKKSVNFGNVRKIRCAVGDFI